MKVLSRIVAVLVVSFSLFQLASIAEAKDLEFSIDFYRKQGEKSDAEFIKLDKIQYDRNETIYINFTIKNNGKKSLYVNRRFYINSKDAHKSDRDIYIVVADSSGKILPYRQTFETGLPRTEDFVLLGPTEETTSERKRNLRVYFELRNPGKYTIEATYQNVHGKEIGINASRGKLISKPITIEIVKER